MTKRDDLVAGHVRKLIDGFDFYVEAYDRLNPFDRSRQLASHVQTLQIRAQLGSASACLADGRYFLSLYETLKVWGIGVRGSRLVAYRAFEQALRDRETDIAGLDGLRIDDPELDIGRAEGAIWTLIKSLGIVENETPLVAGSKALHHLLPDLVTPMDRQYTRPFFGSYSQQFQYQQHRCSRRRFPLSGVSRPTSSRHA